MKIIKHAVCFAALACAAAFVLSGCTGSSTKKAESAAEKADSIIPIQEDEELKNVTAAPEEGDDVDQGREGRPTDSWNSDAPAPSSVKEEAETASKAEPKTESDTESKTESFALADDADDEAAARAE